MCFFADGTNIEEIKASDGTMITIGAGFKTPRGVAVDEGGNVYVCDANGTISELPAGGGAKVTLVSGLNDPTGITVDAAGDIYVTEFGTATITEIKPVGGYFLNKPLPTGLIFNSTNGNITGTPTVSSPATNFTITGYNTDGGTFAVVSIKVESSNAALAALTLSKGSLNPVFSAAANAYTTDVDYPVSSLTITPTTGDKNATVMVNNTTVISGSPSANIPLMVGANTITVVVTASDGATTQTYTVTVNRSPASTNAGLLTLVLSNGVLSPAFATGMLSYNTTVAKTLSTFTLTPTTADTTATVTVNGTTVKSGSHSDVIALSVGANSITIVVTAQDGVTTQTYTLVVNKGISQNADLSNITLSSGMVSPVFVSPTTIYTAVIDNSISSITLTPTVSASQSTVTVNGAPVTSGSPSAGIPLTVGANTITATVTSQQGTTKTYSVTVTRSSTVNVYLSSLTASNGVLIPDFSSGETVYNVYVGNLLTTMTLTPTSADPAATMTVNGSAVTSGSPSSFLPLSVGSNTFHVVVTGSDGTSTLTYTVIVHESKSQNNYLASLTTSSGFAQGLTVPETMTQMVTNEPSAIRVTPTVRDPTSTITVNGSVVASGSPSAFIPLTKGAHTITIVVTAQDQSTRTYTLTIAQAPTPNADLSDIRMNKGTLSPAFAGNVLSYRDTVTNGTTSIALTPVAVDSWASITVNGAKVLSGKQSGPILLSVGLNTITTVVTSSDGTTQKTYTLYILRPSTNNQMSYLDVYYDREWIFGWEYFQNKPLAATVDYKKSATAEVNAYLDDTTSTMTVNGVAVPDNVNSAPIAINAGINVITIVVTAQDKSTRTYTFTLNAVQASGANNPDAELSVDKPVETPQLAQDGITVHLGISPNGDGINDFLQIDNIANYPENHLSIMNRNGQLVYESKGYDNATKVFDGHSNKTGQMQLPGTYFYSLDYTVKGIIKHKTGFLVLKY